MANHTYSKGLLYKKTLNSSGEVTGSVPLLLKTLGSLVIMSDGTDAETAISTAISNMVTPDETTIVTGQDGITISVKKSTSAEIDEILGDVPTEHTWEGYYTKSEVNGLVNAVDAKFNQNDIETALGYTPIASSTKGSANGVASLDANGLVPSAQLPSYVDDVIESATFAALPATGETGKIYVTLNDNKTYRWSGSAYVEISQSLALGETSSTAFAGDKGKTAYEHVSDTTKHVPTGGTNSQYLKNTGNNTYMWASPDSSWPTTPTNNTIPGNKLVDDRFKVNETNILYGLEKIGTNLIKPRDDLPTVVTALPEGLRVQRSNTTSSFAYVKCGTVYLESGKKYALYDATYAPTTKHHYFYVDCGGNGFIELSTPSLTATVQYGTGRTTGTYDIYTRIDANSTVDTISTPIICLESVWKQLEAYTPYGAPNYDLTRLEAEDRAALAEEIDAGAKNKLNWASATDLGYSNCTYSKTDTSLIASAGSSAAESRVFYSVGTFAAGNYVFKFKISSATISQQAIIYISTSTQASTSIASIQITANGEYELPFSWSGGTVYLKFYPNTTNTSSSNTFTVSNMMICTKAAFGVSSKFVPYTKSNSQLTTELGSVKTVLEAIL